MKKIIPFVALLTFYAALPNSHGQAVTASPQMSQPTLVVPKTPEATPPPSPHLPPVNSPEIHPDRRVTFRLRAPAADRVKMWGDWDGKGYDLIKDPEGVWSVTLGPLAPNLYAYSFNVDDSLTIVDPVNPAVKAMRSAGSSILFISGEAPVPLTHLAGVPRGIVHLHDYDSQAIGITRRLRVYTPPGYDSAKPTIYPVLYLLHGSGDNESTWTEFGRANLILDNLIATGKSKPMIVVMTDGHAVNGYAPEARAENATVFENDFLGDVMPLVESLYHVQPDRDHRAIVGLSMGGNQSLSIGLNHRDLFAWVGGMSSAMREPEKQLVPFWQGPVSKKYPLRMLWLRIGRDDFLLKGNRHFNEMLTEKNIPHDYMETDGGHTWPVWRSYLTELAPLLFKEKK